MTHESRQLADAPTTSEGIRTIPRVDPAVCIDRLMDRLQRLEGEAQSEKRARPGLMGVVRS